MSAVTLLRKDLRLSADALRPWGLCVVGFLMCSLALVWAPDAMKPDAISRFDLRDFVAITGTGVAMSALAVAAWIAASVLVGDRTHGAHSLEATIPVSDSSRALPKFAAIGLGVMVPWATATALLALSASDPLSGATGMVILLTLAAEVIGVAHAILLVHALPRVFPLVLASCCSLGAWLFLGWVSARLTFQALTSDLSVVARAGSEEWRVTELIGPAGINGAMLATAAASSLTLAVGIVSHMRPVRRRVLSMTIGIGCVIAVATGAAAAWQHMPSSAEVSTWPSVTQWRVKSMSDEALARSFTNLYPAMVARQPNWTTGLIQAEAGRRVWTHVANGMADNPIVVAFVSAQDFSTAESSIATLQWLVPYLHASEDVRRLQLALDAVAAFPESEGLRGELYLEGDRQKLWSPHEVSNVRGAAHTPDAQVWDLSALLVRGLRDQVAKGHAEAERMRRVLELIAEGEGGTP